MPGVDEPRPCPHFVGARLVHKEQKLTKLLKVEPLDDPALYNEFFVRLGKSAAHDVD